MARPLPPRSEPTWRQRLANMPRWGWLLLLILLCLIAYFVVRHYRTGEQAPAAVSNRALLLHQATATLRADPSVSDVIYNAVADQWDVTPANPDAGARAFGQYVCFLLGEANVLAPNTSVRVIDGAKLEASGFDYNAASRGVVTCGGTNEGDDLAQSSMLEVARDAGDARSNARARGRSSELP